MKESYKSYITLHQFLREAISDLGKHVIEDAELFGDKVTEDNVEEVFNEFFTENSPREIAEVMVNNTYGNYVELSNDEEMDLQKILAKYIMSNMPVIFNRTYSEGRYKILARF